PAARITAPGTGVPSEPSTRTVPWREKVVPVPPPRGEPKQPVTRTVSSSHAAYRNHRRLRVVAALETSFTSGGFLLASQTVSPVVKESWTKALEPCRQYNGNEWPGQGYGKRTGRVRERCTGRVRLVRTGCRLWHQKCGGRALWVGDRWEVWTCLKGQQQDAVGRPALAWRRDDSAVGDRQGGCSLPRMCRAQGDNR